MPGTIAACSRYSDSSGYSPTLWRSNWLGRGLRQAQDGRQTAFRWLRGIGPLRTEPPERSTAHSLVEEDGFSRQPFAKSGCLHQSEKAAASGKKKDSPSLTSLMVRSLGIEPRTCGLRVRCSAS